MLFSDLTPLELYELSGEAPIAERIYDALVASFGDQFDMAVGESRQEAWCYAEALGTARAAVCQESAALQNLPDWVDELLPVREDEYGIRPAWNATFSERVDEYRRRMVRPGTWTANAITALLSELLGTDFIAYRPTPVAEAARFPTLCGTTPMNLQAPTVARKIVRLLRPVSSTGLQPVLYEVVALPADAVSTASTNLVPGDALVVEPEIEGIAERVTVTAVTTSPATFSASFSKAHTDGCLAFTQPFPHWVSTKRHSLVVLTPEAAVDPAKRRVVDMWMRRMVRASSTWDIVSSADEIVTDSFSIGVSPLGATAFGAVSV